MSSFFCYSQINSSFLRKPFRRSDMTGVICEYIGSKTSVVYKASYFLMHLAT